MGRRTMNESWGPRLRIITLTTGLLLLMALAGLLLWNLWPVLSSLPDLLYWALLIAVMAIAAFSIVLRRDKGRARSPQSRMGLEIAQGQNLCRVQELARQITWAQHGGLMQNRLQLELRNLARRLIAIRRGVSAEEARELLRAGGWSGASDLERCLSQERPLPRFPRLRHRIRALIRGQQGDSRFQQELQQAIQELEAYSREESFAHDHNRQRSGRED